MNNETITIKKLWPPYKPDKKNTNLEDTQGNRYSINVLTAAGFHDGETVDIGYTNETTSAEFGSKPYKLIKNIKRVGASQANGSAAPEGDVGPHYGMWEKEAFRGLRLGMTSAQVILLGIEARIAAREIIRTNLDGKLPLPRTAEPYVAPDFNDSLEFPSDLERTYK